MKVDGELNSISQWKEHNKVWRRNSRNPCSQTPETWNSLHAKQWEGLNLTLTGLKGTRNQSNMILSSTCLILTWLNWWWTLFVTITRRLERLKQKSYKKVKPTVSRKPWVAMWNEESLSSITITIKIFNILSEDQQKISAVIKHFNSEARVVNLKDGE